jgi:hypothetical protein
VLSTGARVGVGLANRRRAQGRRCAGVWSPTCGARDRRHAGPTAACAQGSRPPARDRAGWRRRAPGVGRAGGAQGASSISCFVSSFLLLNFFAL